MAALFKGFNAQWGLAINRNWDATLFQTTGKTKGIGAAAGVSFGLQKGSFNSLVAKSGQGGGQTFAVSAAPVSFNENFDDDGKLIGGSAGPKGPLAVGINSTSQGNTIGTTNLREDLHEFWESVKSSVQQFVDEANRAMTYPSPLRP